MIQTRTNSPQKTTVRFNQDSYQYDSITFDNIEDAITYLESYPNRNMKGFWATITIPAGRERSEIEYRFKTIDDEVVLFKCLRWDYVAMAMAGNKTDGPEVTDFTNRVTCGMLLIAMNHNLL